MVIYDIYSVESVQSSMETTVRFRVWEERNGISRVVNECQMTIDGRYELDDDELDAAIVAKYEEEFGNA